MIETTRLVIRRFEAQDCEALYAYLSNPAVYRFEPGEPVSLEAARKMTLERAQGSDYWAVVLRPTGLLVGHLYFKQVAPAALLTWELGYIFNPQFQGQGYASESASALVRYAFEQMGVHRVVAHCNPENVASWRVMEKIGMRREGHLRKNIFFRRAADGSPLWVDTYAYGILREEVNQGTQPVTGT
ncbi:MAG TPA: GNAT family N-acetyltransferase [Anaerolineaceae bacterium]|nr:GNAT family N-acetyltransferase [Anaerolineaceae bacterium]